LHRFRDIAFDIAENFNHLSRVHESYRQTDGRAMTHR